MSKDAFALGSQLQQLYRQGKWDNKIFENFQLLVILDMHTDVKLAQAAKTVYEMAACYYVTTGDLEKFQRYRHVVEGLPRGGQASKRQSELDPGYVTVSAPDDDSGYVNVRGSSFSSGEGSRLVQSQYYEDLCAAGLLYHLAEHEFDNFHTFLEALPRDILSCDKVVFCKELEGAISEGRISVALSMLNGKKFPAMLNKFKGPLTESLNTERQDCMFTAYPNIKQAQAQKVLKLSSQEEFAKLKQARGWQFESRMSLNMVPPRVEVAQKTCKKMLEYAERFSAVI